MDDPFMADYIQDLLRSIRTQVVIRLIQPYTRVHIPFISKVLGLQCFLILVYEIVIALFLRTIAGA